MLAHWWAGSGSQRRRLLPTHWQVKPDPGVSACLLSGRPGSWSLAAGPGVPKLCSGHFRGWGKCSGSGWRTGQGHLLIQSGMRSGEAPVAQQKRARLQCRRHSGLRFHLWTGKIPWRKAWHPTPVFLPGKFHGQRSQAGCSPWGRKESGGLQFMGSQRVGHD